MKSIVLVMFVTLLFIKATVRNNNSFDEGKGITFFEGTWQETLAQAQKEDKLIFLDAYANWCGPCKMMKKNVFTSTKVGDIFNEKFINVKMDMETEEGLALATLYRVSAYPSLFLIDHNGEVKKYAVGYYNVRKLIEFGENTEQN